jgi:hypothetical protein
MVIVNHWALITCIFYTRTPHTCGYPLWQRSSMAINNHKPWQGFSDGGWSLDCSAINKRKIMGIGYRIPALWDQARPLNQEDGCAQLWLNGHHRQFADTQVLQTSSECFWSKGGDRAYGPGPHPSSASPNGSKAASAASNCHIAGIRDVAKRCAGCVWAKGYKN